MPAKTIPPARDRLQSRAIVACGIPILIYISYEAIQFARPAGHSGRVYLAMAAAFSTFFALAAWRLKAATPLAAICGAMICFSITVLSGRPDGSSIFHSGLALLIVLFALTHEATRLRYDRQPVHHTIEDRKGRNAAQVIANLGVATFASNYLNLTFHHPLMRGSQLEPFAIAFLSVPMVAALAEATADTVSSEIGQAFGGMPILLTTLRRVPPGTDGAISLYGTLSGIVVAAIIAAISIPSLGMDLDQCRTIFAGAVAGLFFDSLLGATLERKGWIGNDLVNFTSTGFAVMVALFMNNHAVA